MFIANTFWAHLFLRRLARILDAERILRSADNSREKEARSMQSRAALRWAFATILVVYVLGGTLQSKNLLVGLMITLWVLLPVMTWFSARANAREVGWKDALALRLPTWQHALGALFVAPGIGWLASIAIQWQTKVLPFPRSAAESASGLLEVVDELHPALLIFFFAISPGICEELFFRGAILSSLRRDLPPLKVVLWQALLFGLVHLSIYRFLPTAILGGLLAMLTLRSRSLIPAILMHAAYNSTALFDPWTCEYATLMKIGSAVLAILGVALLSRKR